MSRGASKKAVAIFVVAVTVILSGIDVFLSLDDVQGNTFSSVIRDFGVSFGWAPYAVAGFLGVLITHWFGKRDKDGNYTPREKALLITIMLGVVGAGMIVGLFW